MAQLIVPGVARFAVEQRFFGRPVVNILDMKINDESAIQNRPTFCLDQAKIIVRKWKEHILPIQSNSLELLKVSWIDLDTATGSTGEVPASAELPLGNVGGTGGDPLPPSVAILVTKVASGGRGTKNGRMYICGLAENGNQPDFPMNVGAATMTALQTKLPLFAQEINQESGTVPPFYDSDLSVIHQRVGLPATHSTVSALIPQQLLGTQRRRMRP